MSHSGKAILIIDDDRDIREAVADVLVDEGYRAVAVGDGVSGIDYLRREVAPGLILLDWNMTPMNGQEFMEQFGKEPRWASIPIALLTADSRVREKVELASFVGCLGKPTNLTDLLSLVERYCR